MRELGGTRRHPLTSRFNCCKFNGLNLEVRKIWKCLITAKFKLWKINMLNLENLVPPTGGMTPPPGYRRGHPLTPHSGGRAEH